MRRAADAGETVSAIGGETASTYGLTRAATVDLELSTAHLDRVVGYAPGDLIIEVEAGMKVAAIDELVAKDGLRLALDPPEAARASIGGAVACNAFGPLRRRYGMLRDLVVGMSLVRADGILVRGGGRVVKNVAGFDIPKLAIGSLGTLGAIATVTLRLHPRPTASAALYAEIADLATIVRLEAALEADQLEPAATLASRSPERPLEGWRYAVVFEGFAAGVEEQVARAIALAARLGIELRRSDAANEVRADHDARNRTNVLVQISLPRASLGELDALLAAYRHGESDPTCPIVFPAIGVAFVAIDLQRPDAFEEALAPVLARTRERVETLGGHLVAVKAPAGAFDAFGTPPAAAGLMRALRARFDPERRLNPNHSVGGI